MKPTQNRTEIINSLSNAGLGDFENTEEMGRAHELLRMMLANDAPKKRERRKNNYDPRAASEANHEITKGHH